MLLQLLHTAPGVTALVTSRTALRVRGERAFPVAPLPCPPSAENDEPDALLAYPAVALLVQRAQEVRATFAPARGNAAALAAICRQLDGLPLALELAAARMRILSPEALLGRLGQRLALLTAGPRDLPARQQSLRATIAWSYELLDPAEQAFFRRLAVFAGDFSLAAAAVVGSTDTFDDDGAARSLVAEPSVRALDLLTSLVEQNLLRQREGPEGESRFVMLETVREFGLEQLELAGDADRARRAHAACYVAFAQAAAPHLRGAQRLHWFRRIDEELDNLRAVVAWSSARTDDGEALVRIVRALGFIYWRAGGHVHEGWRWCELALATPAAASPATRMGVLWIAGALAGYMGTYGTARAWLEECVQLARAASDDTILGYALVFLGWSESQLGERAAAVHIGEALDVLRTSGTPDDLVLALNVAAVPYTLLHKLAAARAVVTECLAIARDLDDAWSLAIALSNAAYLDLNERDWPSAGVHLEQSLVLQRHCGDEGSIAVILNNLAVVARQQGDHDRSGALLEHSLAQQRRLGLTGAITLYNLGDWALHRQAISRARAYLAQALREALRGGEQQSIVVSLGGLGRLAAAAGRSETAARLIGAAEGLRERADVRTTLEYRRDLEQAADVTRRALGQQAFRLAAAGGATTPLAELAAEALAWVETLPLPDLEHDPPLTPPAAAPPRGGALSPRELEVLRLIAGGKSNREIATGLVISLNTVARHVSNIFDKIGATNRTEAAAYAHRAGLAD
jgi:predicted ATPase/DNA-binding CsgD family transcriptional regulator